MSKAAQAVERAVRPKPAPSPPDQPNQLLPAMSEHTYEAFKADIRERGVLVPVELDPDGNIVDGHHRAKAAAELGIAYPTITRSFASDLEKRLHIVAINAYRRHLTDAQRVALGEKVEADVAERARLRQLAHLKHGDEPPSWTNGHNGHSATRDEVAELVGLGSGRTYERDKAVIAEIREKAPALMPQVESGELDIRRAKIELNKIVGPAKPKSERDQSLDDVFDGIEERLDVVDVEVRVRYLAETGKWRTRVIDGEERSYRRERQPLERLLTMRETTAVLTGEPGLRELCNAVGNRMYRELLEGWPDREPEEPEVEVGE